MIILLLPFTSVCSVRVSDKGWDAAACNDIICRKDGRNDGNIGLSVLGEVYDVTEGRKFYGEGTSYGFFAAKDASACFASGKFNEEGLKQPLDDLSSSQLEAVEQWRKFYVDKDNYHFVGVLQ